MRSVDRLGAGIESDAATKRNSITYYGVNATPEISASSLPVHRCSIGNITAPDFRTCLCRTPKPTRPRTFPDRQPSALPATRP